MTLNLTGSYFGDDIGFGQSPNNDLMKTNSRAVLYVFKPYQNQFGDVGMRPFIYNFDENFLHGAQEITDLSKRGSADAPMMMESLMTQNNLNDHLMPSSMPSMVFKGSHLTDRWRFILILTEAASDLSIGNTVLSSNSNSQMRRIYNGYFEDEPFNPATFSTSRRTLNPNSFMVITHKTIVGTATEHGQHGGRTMLNTWASEEVIHPQLSKALTAGVGMGGDLFLMTPENCINSIDSTEDGYSTAVPGAHSSIARDTGAHVMSDILEQPAHNVAQVVKGMIKYQDEVSHRDRLSSRRVNSYFEDSFMDESLQRQKLGRYMSLGRSRRMGRFDLDVDSRISPVDLDAMVDGALDVIDFDIERPIYYETADQEEASITNQYSFLIASVISPILNSAGLNQMQFEYEIARIRGQVQDNFIVYSAASNWPVPDDDLRSMTIAVKVELINGIFATIFGSKGDFNVKVSADATGMTQVRLSLVGMGIRNPVDFELPSFMGGLITPLIGDAASNATNSESIETMYNIATGTKNISNAFDDNDRSFMNYANTVDFGGGDMDLGISMD